MTRMPRLVPPSALLILTLAAGLGSADAASAQGESTSFDRFLKELWLQAQARGVTRPVFVAAFANLTPDPQVLALTKAQPEYNKPVGPYLASRVAPGTVAAGLRQAAAWAEVLARAEREFGIERWVLLSIWGLESGYGAVKGNLDVIRSLATLAHARYRDDFFRNELLSALAILQAGDVARERLIGSWAGAMGQPQFLPSSFVQHALDFSGDGRRDIWTSVPDVLGSIANYLRKNGWKPGMSWGFEVVVPQGFDYRRSRGSFREWAARGLRRADGGALPTQDDAILLFPSGARGPAFLVTENFVVIKRYNNSDAYALAVAHLADRLRGLGPIRGRWPDDDRPLARENRIALQRGLAALGYPVSNFVGQIDFDLRDMVREIQVKAGMVPDGNPTAAVLERVRTEAARRGR
jgi:peptidoglycan lytic transglycosylase B